MLIGVSSEEEDELEDELSLFFFGSLVLWRISNNAANAFGTYLGVQPPTLFSIRLGTAIGVFMIPVRPTGVLRSNLSLFLSKSFGGST